MADTDTNIIETTSAGAPTPEAALPVAPGAPTDRRAPRGRAGGRSGGAPARGGDRRGPRAPRVKSEFDQKMINIRRVARVVAGGRRFSFSVAIIIGNKKGRVGVGLGKAGDTTLAIDKAVRDAKKHMITVSLTQDSSIVHEVAAKFCAARVSIMPAPRRGLVAGSSVRPVLELAGITNVAAKIHSGSKNGLNNARAAIEALKQLKG